jgi:hypothetical protein
LFRRRSSRSADVDGKKYKVEKQVKKKQRIGLTGRQAPVDAAAFEIPMWNANHPMCKPFPRRTKTQTVPLYHPSYMTKRGVVDLCTRALYLPYIKITKRAHFY